MYPSSLSFVTTTAVDKGIYLKYIMYLEVNCENILTIMVKTSRKLDLVIVEILIYI